MRPGETTLNRLLGPIQEPLNHPSTTEVVIQQPGEVGIEQGGKWSWMDVPEFTFDRLDAISLLAGKMQSHDFDAAHPIVETNLPWGHRYTAIRPPITLDGTISVTMRKPLKRVPGVNERGFWDQPVDALADIAYQSHPADEELLRLHKEKSWARFFPLAVQSGKTIAAVGPQKSGKTTLLRAIMQSIPTDDRVVTVEDSEEFLELPVVPMMQPLRNRVSLFYGKAGVTAEKSILTSLRMAADRVAIQELRHEEAYAFLRIHQAGQTGSFVSWHADPSDPFGPLELMVKSHPVGRNIPSDKLSKMLRNIVDVIAHCRRDPVSKRFSLSSVYFRPAGETEL
jgi:type IV secretion system protein VirB11